MRTIRLPPDDARTVVWQHVTGVRFVAEGRRRFLVLTYKNGAEVHLLPHRARDVWYEVSEPRGCPEPCFFRHEADTAPTECMECALAQALEGVDVLVRPDPIPPRRSKPFDWRNVAIVFLLFMVMVLIGVADAAKKSPTPDEHAPQKFRKQSPSEVRRAIPH